MAILALHGFTGCGGDFAPLALLSSYEWHYPDLPGHGKMHSAQCTPEATVDWVNNLAKSIPSPKILLGYSMGARAALLHAVQYPQTWDAIILISGNPGIEDAVLRQQRRKSDEALALKVVSEGVPAFIDYWEQQAIIQSQGNIQPKWRKTMRSNRLKHSPEGLANSLRYFGQGQFPNLWPQLDTLKMPILCISGEEDTKYTEISTRIAQYTFAGKQIGIQQAGHCPHLEIPSISLDIMHDFLKKNTH